MQQYSQTIIFEYPMNEKIRGWLRIEFLLKQLFENTVLYDINTTLNFFRVINDLIDILDRGEVKTELVKELERQKLKLTQWVNVPGVDIQRLNQLQVQIQDSIKNLLAVSRPGHALRDDKFISAIRQRLSIPGGCCNFDLPTLYLWMQSEEEKRVQQINVWLKTLTPLHDSLSLLLSLIRQSGPFQPTSSTGGFYQDNADNVDLLRICIPLEYSVYPQISGHKSRFAIRFLPLDNEAGHIPENLRFELACC